MIDLGSPVGVVPKIGARYKFMLEKLIIFTVGDLLYHFPYRYDDYSEIKNVTDLIEGETVTVETTLDKIQNIYTRSSKKLTLAEISDETGKMKLMWFNQQYIKKQLNEGGKYRFSGKISKYQNKPTIFNPSFENAEDPFRKTGKLAAIYPETQGVKSSWISSRINDVLLEIEKQENKNIIFKEFMPKEIVDKHNFIDFESALKHIHFPKDEQQIESARKRLEFEELFLELLKVENRKSQWHEKKVAVRIEKKRFIDKINDFISSLPFELTDSQKTAADDIFEDIEKDHPMNRLLEGDVGTGKTIVAVIISYLTFLCGYKVLYMAPTEILAKQHFDTFKTYLEQLGVKISLITGNKKLDALKDSFDVLIGTHAILYNIQKVQDVGLIVIDEQHRFGVEQRTELMQISEKVTPHMLTMTATPIPRTLALTIYGDLSLSTLKTSPNKDKKITTRAVPEKLRDQAYRWIRNRGESTFIVCPLIEESMFEGFENIKAATAEFENLKNGAFNGMEMGLLHGRMKS
ncbi:MAG: DEAD/DEAH box helicase, partial [Patescibacteria group bacterium]